MRTDQGRLIISGSKYFYQVNYVFRGRVFYLQGDVDNSQDGRFPLIFAWPVRYPFKIIFGVPSPRLSVMLSILDSGGESAYARAA